jgi:hypothetical protein
VVALLVTVTFRGSAESPRRDNPPPADTNCYPASTNVICSPEPTPQFLSVTESNQCVAGAMIVASATYTNIPGTVTTTITFSNANCPPVVSNVTVYSAILTNWWDAGCTNGGGLSAAFSPTNCGGGTISFYITYSNAPPCSNHLTIQTSIGWSCDCDCTHHILNPTPLSPGTQSCDGITWSGQLFTTACGNTAQLTCTPCGSYHCLTFLVNGANVGHCPYLPSLWEAKYYRCQCGAVIMKSYWDVKEDSPPIIGPGVNCGYNISWDCTNGLSAPYCYWADGSPRTCGPGDW